MAVVVDVPVGPEATSKMAKRIFINYRRDDTIATAGRLRDRLAREFGRDNVFMDIDTIPVGVDFVKHLETWLTDCKIVIALIGPQWVSLKDETDRRRIENINDYVRLELATALRDGIMIVPVLVDGAAMPDKGDLPEELAPLVNRNAIELRNTQFRWDADRLVEKLREVSGLTPRRVVLLKRLAAAAFIGAICLGGAGYQFGWFGLSSPDMRVPAGFDASDFRPRDTSTPPRSCDGSPAPEAVPIQSEGLANLALLRGAIATASSVVSIFPDRHRIIFLNDGWYNNCRSWIPESMPAWAEIDLGAVYRLHKVRFGSEHSAHWSDRAATEFTIRVRKTERDDWVLVYEHTAQQGPVDKTSEFSFPPKEGRYVRIDLTATERADLVRIDELEVYGRRLR